MSKVVPVRVDIGEVLKVAESFGEVLAIIPQVFHGASLAARDIPTAVKVLVSAEDLEKAAEVYESEELLAVRAEITALEAEWEQKRKAGVSRKEMTPLAIKIGELEDKVAELQNLNGMIMARAAALIGKEKLDYTSQILEWSQQKEMTKVWLKREFDLDGDVFITLPAPGNAPFHKADEGHIALAAIIEAEKKLKVVAILPRNGDNSTFFKDVSALVGRPNATNGVNSVKPFKADGYAVSVSGKCKRLYKDSQG